MSRPGARRTAAALGLAGVVALLALAGCGGDDEPSPTTASPTQQTQTATTSPASESPSPTASDTATGAAPAAGEAVTLPGFTAHAPDGWAAVSVSDQDARYRKGDASVYFFTFPSGPASLDDAAQVGIEGYDSFDTPPVRGEDREVDGVAGYTLTGPVDGYAFFYQWGAVVDGQLVNVEVTDRAADTDAQTVVDSVLASMTFD